MINKYFAGFLALFLMAGCTLNDKGRVAIRNESHEIVAEGEVEICNQRFQFNDIRPGQNIQILYKVTSDSHYSVIVEFGSGKKLVKELGYVTNGSDFDDTLIVKDEDVIIRNPND